MILRDTLDSIVYAHATPTLRVIRPLRPIRLRGFDKGIWITNSSLAYIPCLDDVTVAHDDGDDDAERCESRDGVDTSRSAASEMMTSLRAEVEMSESMEKADALDDSGTNPELFTNVIMTATETLYCPFQIEYNINFN